MRKQLFYIVNFLWLLTALYFLYYLLMEDNYLSITNLMTLANQFAKLGHICLIGFLPIYLGLIIFGMALLFFYIRARVRLFLTHYVGK